MWGRGREESGADASGERAGTGVSGGVWQPSVLGGEGSELSGLTHSTY